MDAANEANFVEYFKERRFYRIGRDGRILHRKNDHFIVF